jgi:microcystin-dependent protein
LPPTGFHNCDGSLLQISSYAALFSLISNTYGGDGVKTFAVPHLPAPIGHGGLYVICVSGGIYPS